jgi:transcriptional regulator with XRE-family HTH domain
VQKQPETLGELIKAARDKSDLTVEELTARVGISERYLYRIENEGKIPKFEVLKKLIRELAIDANSIFYPEKPTKDSEVEDLVRMLYNCDDRSMKIVRATAKAALESQTEKE